MITLFGATGSGKSIQGQILSRRLGWAWYSSRDMLSSMHNKDIMYKLDHGMFVDDDTMNSLMRDVMRRVERMLAVWVGLCLTASLLAIAKYVG